MCILLIVMSFFSLLTSQDDFDESFPKDLDFYPNLLVGTDSGHVKLINILNGQVSISAFQHSFILL